MEITLNIDEKPKQKIKIGDVVVINSSISGDRTCIVFDLGDEFANRIQLLSFDGHSRWNRYKSVEDMIESLNRSEYITKFTVLKQEDYELVLKNRMV